MPKKTARGMSVEDLKRKTAERLTMNEKDTSVKATQKRNNNKGGPKMTVHELKQMTKQRQLTYYSEIEGNRQPQTQPPQYQYRGQGPTVSLNNKQQQQQQQFQHQQNMQMQYPHQQTLLQQQQQQLLMLQHQQQQQIILLQKQHMKLSMLEHQDRNMVPNVNNRSFQEKQSTNVYQEEGIILSQRSLSEPYHTSSTYDSTTCIDDDDDNQNNNFNNKKNEELNPEFCNRSKSSPDEALHSSTSFFNYEKYDEHESMSSSLEWNCPDDDSDDDEQKIENKTITPVTQSGAQSVGGYSEKLSKPMNGTLSSVSQLGERGSGGGGRYNCSGVGGGSGYRYGTAAPMISRKATSCPDESSFNGGASEPDNAWTSQEVSVPNRCYSSPDAATNYEPNDTLYPLGNAYTSSNQFDRKSKYQTRPAPLNVAWGTTSNTGRDVGVDNFGNKSFTPKSSPQLTCTKDVMTTGPLPSPRIFDANADELSRSLAEFVLTSFDSDSSPLPTPPITPLSPTDMNISLFNRKKIEREKW